jgi:hypothetical protein
MLGVAAAVCLAATPVHADQRGNGKGGAVHGPTKAPAPKAAPSTTTTQHGNPHVKTTPTTSTTTSKTTKKTPTTTTTTISPVAAKIASHPQLATRVKALLPDGMTLKDAAAGFSNQGQFIAALHVSRNLNIPFGKLQLEMTGPDHLSLGQAIQKLRSGTTTTTATTEVHHAEIEANEDLKVAKVKVERKHKKHGDDRR